MQDKYLYFWATFYVMKKIYFILPILAMSVSCSVEHIITATPMVFTYEPQDIQDTHAAIGGYVHNNGGTDVTERGVVISTSSAIPTVSDTKLLSGTGEGEFFGIYDGLEDNTTYYYRAFGTNATGTGYGEAFSFTTLPSACDPAVIDFVNVGPAGIEVENVVKQNWWINYDNGNVQFITQQQGNYLITLQFNEAQQQLPQTGIYTTAQIFLNSDPASDRKVKIYLSDNGTANNGHLAPNGEFLFVENTNGYITFTFCDTYINPQYTLTGRFIYLD